VGDTWWQELLGGAAGAVVVPLALSVLWGRFRRAGAIAGVMLGALFHVSLALLLLSGFYVVAETAVTDRWTGLRRLIRRVMARWRALVGVGTLVAAVVALCLAF